MEQPVFQSESWPAVVQNSEEPNAPETMEDLLKRLTAQEEQNNSSIKVLEANVSNTRRDLDVLMADVREIRTLVTQIAIQQGVTASKVTCPAPGLCVELREQMEKLAASVQGLVETRAENRGAGKAVMILGTALGGLGGVLTTIVLHLVTKGKMP